jgi:hypothetical protein
VFDVHASASGAGDYGVRTKAYNRQVIADLLGSGKDYLSMIAETAGLAPEQPERPRIQLWPLRRPR